MSNNNDEFIDNGDGDDDDDDPGADVNEHIVSSDGEKFLRWILIGIHLNDTSNYQASTTFNFSHDFTIGSPKC